MADGRPVLLVSYQLRYPPRTDDSGQSRIEGVRECADALGRTCKPETTFKWQDTLPGTTGGDTIPASRPSTDGWPTTNRFVPGYRAKLPFVNAPTQLVMPIDLDGDGRQDLLYPTAGEWHVLISQTLPDGALTYRDVPTGIRARAVTPFDQDGDGRTDLLLHDDSLESAEHRWRFVRSLGDRFSAPINAGAASDRDIFVQQGQGGDFIFSETVTRVLDEDGDGKNEVLICQPNGAWRRLFATKPAPGGHCLSQSVFVMDLQGVGRTDVLISDGADTDFFPGTDIRRSEIAGSLVSPSGDGPTRERHPTWARTGDFNGDGLQDVLVFGQAADGTFSRLLYNRGDGDGAGRRTTFERADAQAIAAVSGPFNALNPGAYSVMDANLDGKQEVVAVEDPQGALVDFDGDGLADALSGWNISRARHRGLAPPMHITEIRNGLVSGFPSAPPTVQIRYQPMVGSALTDVPGAPPVYTPAPTFCSLPRRCLRTGRFLVREVTSDVGGGTTAKALYAYEDARAIIDGRGWLGFAKRTVIDRRASVGTTTVTEFHNGGPDPATGLATDHRLAGLVRKSTETTALPGGRTHVATTSHAWSIRGGASYFPVLDRTESSETENGATLRSSTTTQSTDDHGCVYESTTTRGDGGSTTQRIQDWAPVSASPQLPDWILCLPRRVQLTSRQPVDREGTDEKTRLVETEYDPTTHLAVRVTRDPEARDPRFWQQREIGRDRYGNVTSVKVRRMGEERSSTVTFDAQGYFPTRTVNPRGHVVELRHHYAWGHLLVRQDENGISSRYAFDAFGWRALEQHGYRSAALAEDDWITHELAALTSGPGYTVRSVATAGGDTTSTFDTLGRVVRSCAAVLGTYDQRTGARTSATSCVDTAYNEAGLVASSSRPYPAGGAAAHFFTFEYDPLGRVLARHRPNGEVETTVYEGRTATTTEANPQRSRTRTVVGERGELVESTSGLGSSSVSSASYVYGAFGALRRIDRPGASTKITTDAYGRRVVLDDPDTACTATTYNAFDEVDTVADHFDSKDCSDLRGAHTAQYFRDEIGRVVRRLDDGNVETRWNYDASRFGIGKIASTQSAPNAPSSTVYYRTHTYDALSRPQAEILQMDLRAGLGSFYITSRTYDAHGRVSAIGYPSSLLMGGVRVEQEYDDRSGALGAVYRSFPGGRRGPLLWRADAVDPDGQLAHETFGNRLPTTRSYDPPTGRQTAIVTGEHYPNVVQDLHYDYHPGGNLKWRESRAEEGGTEREEFTFDELNRLRTASTNGTQTLDVTYDALGNITSKTGLGAYLYQSPRSGGAFKPHAVTQAGGVQLAYDTAGLLINRRDSATRTDQTIEYTAFGKPRRMSAAGGDPETFFEYDADETRVVRTAGLRRTVYVSGLYEWTNVAGTLKPGERAQSHRYFVYAGGRVVAEILRNIDIPSVPISYLAVEQVRYYHDDHLGSTHVITDGDGRRVESVSYDAFGARRRSSDWSATSIPWSEFRPASIGFTGHEDDVFGLINMKGRIYDPRLGRFLQPDPIVQAPHYTQSLNRYSYVWNNPLRMTDPSGFAGVEVINFEQGSTIEIPRVDFEEGSTIEIARPPGQTADGENPAPPGSDDPQPSTRGSLDVNTPPGNLPGDFKPLIVKDGAPQHSSIPRVNGTASADSARLRVWTNSRGEKCIGYNCTTPSGGFYDTRIWGGAVGGRLMADGGFKPNLDFASLSAEGALFIVGMVELPGSSLLGPLGKAAGKLFKTEAKALKQVAAGGAARALPSALRGGEATTHVYFGVRNGERVYVGITNDIARRAAEHGSRFRLQPITTSPVTRGEARAIEQALINRNPGFANIRNSISPNHSWYGEAVEWGRRGSRRRGTSHESRRVEEDAPRA